MPRRMRKRSEEKEGGKDYTEENTKSKREKDTQEKGRKQYGEGIGIWHSYGILANAKFYGTMIC